MAFDGISIACVMKELNDALTGGRIEKITQPERDEINIIVRNNGRNMRLVASASSSSPRIHLTEIQKENPEKAPMFCMLLRKHLTGGKVSGFCQPDFERVLKMQIECLDELGDLSVKNLVIEIMGRHSNIILTDADEKILGSIKHVDFTVSSVRQVLPGMLYEMPPSQDKLNPLKITADELLPIVCASNLPADRLILENFTGIGPLNAREMAYLSLGDTSADISLLSKKSAEAFVKTAVSCFDKIKSHSFCPVILYKNGAWDFNAFDIMQYGDTVKTEKKDSLCKALDEFYTSRDRQERMSQKSASLLKFIDNNIARCQKKLALQQKKLVDSEKREQHKMYGDLIVANLHKLSEGMAFAEVENYYDGMSVVKIPLLPELTPSRNAQRYYSLYQKAKTAEKMSKEQIKLTETELNYLESVKECVSRAENERDVSEIKSELSSQGYSLGRAAPIKSKRDKPTEPHKFTVDGFEVFVGKNNLQNDRLTLREASACDIWFHVKSFPGSHTVMRTNGQTPPDDTIVKAAKIAAYYSKAKDSSNVPVDYTSVKNVKKPSGAKPGMVIYVNYSTVNVIPQKPSEQV